MDYKNKTEKENFRPPCLYTSRFEEQKVKSYLGNLLPLKFVEHRAVKCFNFAIEVLGDEAMLGFVEKVCPDLAEKNELAANRGNELWPQALLKTTLIKVLRRGVYPFLLEQTNTPAEPEESELERRLTRLCEVFRLTYAEIELLTFRYLIGVCHPLTAYLFNNRDIADFSIGRILAAHGHMLLGLPRGSFLEAITGERLVKAGLFQPPGDMISLTSWCEQYLSGFTSFDLNLEFFSRENEETLSVLDFDLSDQEREILGSLLLDDRGHNLLFYGTPGTGKTALARSLAKAHGKELFTVKIPESEVPTARLQGIYATLNAACKEESLILIDEADELLNAASSSRFESKVAKSWINGLLESHGQKIIWITNRSEEIDPSTMRRFSFAIEFSRFNDERRLKVMHHELRKLGLEGCFPEMELKHLCRMYRVNADGIVKATSVAALHAARGPEAALAVLKAALKNHERVTHMHGTGRWKGRDFCRYSLEGLNASQDLGEVITMLEAYLRRQHREPAGPMALLLHGLPGSGKTEFVYYLGERLRKDVLLKRASDIISKWVGETEQQIAQAFEEAQAGGKLLFFDEADTFLFPRTQAQHSWEKSFTNEILAQLQNYEGIVAFATNMIEGLDHAAIRRFRFKIEFRPLTPEGNVLFYTELLAPLRGGAGPTAEEVALLKSIPDLTPGDFAVVREQHLYADPSRISHRVLIESLARESAYKVRSGRTIGFASPNETRNRRTDRMLADTDSMIIPADENLVRNRQGGPKQWPYRQK
jgi:transitional endoplasmic reticulum ATPase